MAKKKSTRKKSGASHKEKLYFGHSFFFIMVVGGGFLVISLMLLVQGNPRSLFRQNAPQVQVEAQEEVTPAGTVVTIDDQSFGENYVTVKAGDSVTWRNTDMVAHEVVAADGTFGTGDIQPDGTGQVTFTTPGVYDYYCSYHPGMRGQVEVVE